MRRTVLIAALACAALGAAAGLGSWGGGGLTPAARQSRARMIGMLAVLRRAQRPGDVDAELTANVRRGMAGAGCWALPVDLVRRVGTAPSGEGVFMVAFGPARCGAPWCASLPGGVHPCSGPPPAVETEALVSDGAPRGLVSFGDADGVAAGRGFDQVVVRGTRAVDAMLVPDRVRTVSLAFAAGVAGPRARTLTLTVHDNVVIWQSRLGTPPSRIRWLDSAGRALAPSAKPGTSYSRLVE